MDQLEQTSKCSVLKLVTPSSGRVGKNVHSTLFVAPCSKRVASTVSSKEQKVYYGGSANLLKPHPAQQSVLSALDQLRAKAAFSYEIEQACLLRGHIARVAMLWLSKYRRLL